MNDRSEVRYIPAKTDDLWDSAKIAVIAEDGERELRFTLLDSGQVVVNLDDSDFMLTRSEVQRLLELWQAHLRVREV